VAVSERVVVSEGEAASRRFPGIADMDRFSSRNDL